MRAPRALLSWLLGLVALAGSCGVARAHGPRTLELGKSLDELLLGGYLELLEDPSGALTLHDVQSPALAAQFRPATVALPSFGYTRSAYWVRLRVHNPTGSEQRWLLEFAHPLTDQLTLFVPGEVPRITGDHHPFASRDLPHRNFVFRLREPPESTRTYHLRVRTDGAMVLPLAAWDEREMMAHKPRTLGALFAFYGICLATIAYNLFAFALVRRKELLTYIAQVLATGLLELNLSGHTLQFVFPDQPRVAESLFLGGFAAIAATSCYISDAYLSLGLAHPRLSRVVRCAGHVACAMGPLAFVLPFRAMVNVLAVLLASMAALLVLVGGYLVHVGAPRVKLFLLMVSVTLAGIATQYLRWAGVLPTNFWTNWSIHIGCSLQLVMLSSALADWLSSMRSDVSALNAQLSSKVAALEDALAQAEHATAQAEQATRARDEFVATMSHELRTPLNAIINVPQGLLREFRKRPAATCGRCRTVFELEPNEHVDEHTACPECEVRGQMRAHDLVQYRGQASRTAHFLAMIERSGKHLLQMVDSVLDASKLGAGRLTVTVEPCDVRTLVSEVIEEMGPAVERAGIAIAQEVAPEVGVLGVDPTRLKQVLFNLLSNAIKFSDQRGPVTLRVRDAGERYEFAVQDRGIGIAERDFGRIFTSFEQVHQGNTRKYGGTGLGLSISRSLVRMHGGEMWFHSELGRGSTFYFDIPKRLGESAALVENDNAAPAAARSASARGDKP